MLAVVLLLQPVSAQKPDFIICTGNIYSHLVGKYGTKLKLSSLVNRNCMQHLSTCHCLLKTFSMKQNCPQEKEQIFPVFYLFVFICITPSLWAMSTRTKGFIKKSQSPCYLLN